MEIRRKKIAPLILLLILASSTLSATIKSTHWKTLENGLSYKKIEIQGAQNGYIHAFRVNPKKFSLDIVTAKEYGIENAPIKALAQKSHALVAINGGFFTPEYKPLGLIIKGGKVINPLKKTSWWGIFGISNKSPLFAGNSEFKIENGITMAIQCGPRLVINGSIPKLKPALAERSAVCATREGNIILMATENAPLSTTDLAEILRSPEREGGFDCVNALNLDGGSSTQLYAEVKGFKLNVIGLGPIVNGIGVYSN